MNNTELEHLTRDATCHILRTTKGIVAMVHPDFVCCDADKRELTFAFSTTDWEMSPAGLLHGGILSTMFDISLGALISPYAGGFAPTIQLTVTFLAPVPLGETLHIHAKIVSLGKSVIHAEASAVVQGTGKLAATGKGIYSVKIWKSKLEEAVSFPEPSARFTAV
ncbi:MAG: PaaI family thioesterase [Clostridiales Family XIII bacterium]|nr:PaaI family thioesterase [Clostridiales Family XIII bacterium]